MFRLFSFCFLAWFSTASMAQALVVSTHPLYLIAEKVTKNIETPTLLLADQTGHDVSLTPAHRKTIQDAGLIIWLGKAHEAPLERVLKQNPKAIALLEAGIMQTLPQRSERGAALKNTVDSHVWLDPNNAVRIAFFIAALRSQQMPEHRDAYWNNARAFAQELFATAHQLRGLGAAQPYWAYHDAYQYLERALNLKFAGSLTNDPHIAPTVAQIKYLNDHRPNPKMCLLAEGHASKNQYMKLNPIVFQKVDESMRGTEDFVQAWQQLAKQTKACVLNARK
jgi:zinc transport system substrate-binding protein